MRVLQVLWPGQAVNRARSANVMRTAYCVLYCMYYVYVYVRVDAARVHGGSFPALVELRVHVVTASAMAIR